mmetsp:Transcript_17787/g.57560  ORF Transcript_17787/g.57560 Transcript_17787/m.57560 type:complete len:209 (-) Transcript_17787:928-1554(-)
MSDATVQIFASVLGIRARCRSMPPDDMITLPPLISWTYSSSIFFAPVFVTIHSPAPAFPSLHFSQLFPFLHFSQNARRRYVGSTIPNCRTSKLSGAPARSSPKGRPRLAPSSEGMTRSSSATAKTSSPSSNPCRRALNCETTLPSSSFEQVVPWGGGQKNGLAKREPEIKMMGFPSCSPPHASCSPPHASYSPPHAQLFSATCPAGLV